MDLTYHHIALHHTGPRLCGASYHCTKRRFLTCEDKNKNPPTALMAAILAPPDDCPDASRDDVQLWELEPRNILMGHKVAWSIIATAAGQGYSTLADLADLYEDVASTKTNAPGELGFADGVAGFNAQTSK